MSEMLPQPPPNAPAPPPSEFELASIRRRNWLFGIGVLSVILVIGLAYLFFYRNSSLFRHRKGRGQTEAISNARQIGFALFEFEVTYGRYPDSSTIAAVKRDFPTSTIQLGTHSSNDFFRQFFVTGITQSESMFYARLPTTTHKPDNVFTGSRMLEKGECGFAYIAGLSADDNPGTPIVLWPMMHGKRLFDYKLAKKYQDGKAVALRLDNSVTTLPIDKSGHVYINGKDLFDPTQPFWNGKPPDIKWPE